MRLSTLAARDDTAQKRMMTAAAILAERYGLEVDLRVQAREGQVRAVLQRERIADFLTALVEVVQTEPAPAETAPRKRTAAKA